MQYTAAFICACGDHDCEDGENSIASIPFCWGLLCALSLGGQMDSNFPEQRKVSQSRILSRLGSWQALIEMLNLDPWGVFHFHVIGRYGGWTRRNHGDMIVIIVVRLHCILHDEDACTPCAKVSGQLSGRTLEHVHDHNPSDKCVRQSQWPLSLLKL